MPTAPRKAALSLVAAASLATLAACGTSNDAADADKAGGATQAKGGAGKVTITMTSGSGGDTCHLSTTTAPAGPITFTVKNESATGLTEIEILQEQKIIGEKESLAPGLPAAPITLTLGGGTYQVYCPGAVEETIPFTVTGEARAASGSAAALLAQGASQYGGYVTAQVQAMVAAVQKLQQDIDAGDVVAAQKQYGAARPFYEKIESDVDGFVLPGFGPTDNRGNLDYLVDMRASNLDPAVGWHGFHALERDLFGDRRITASTKRLAAELTANVHKLAELSRGLTYRPEDLANGAAGLLEEVQANKISGEEEEFSHIDLVDFASNAEGAQQAFAYLKPGLKELDAGLTDTISRRFATVTAMLDTYRDPHAIGGYRRYSPELKRTDANKLSQAVQALQDSLAHLAEKVATAR